MRVLRTAVVVGLVLAAGASFAQQKGKKQSLHDQMTGQGYGMAGCGLGSIVFGDKPGMIQVVAATLNSTGYQTFAITTGTSNCGDSGKSAQTTQFIETNRVALEKEISRGQGEAVDSLGKLMACKNPNFSSDLRKNYSNSFPQGSATVGGIEAVAYQSCAI